MSDLSVYIFAGILVLVGYFLNNFTNFTSSKRDTEEEKRLRAVSSELSLKNKNIRTSKVPQSPEDKNLSEKVKNIKAQNEESIKKNIKAQNEEIIKNYNSQKIAPDPEQSEQTPKKVWPWPIIEMPGGTNSNNDFGNGYWEEISPLKMFGYTVGKTSGWPAAKRKRFLSDFMGYDLPATVEKIYGKKYGDPGSLERLKAVANLISSLIIAAKRRNGSSMKYAIQDWTDDLNFLKTAFYEDQGLKFYPWPSAEPK